MDEESLIFSLPSSALSLSFSLAFYIDNKLDCR